jgi:hypothetical protein
MSHPFVSKPINPLTILKDDERSLAHYFAEVPEAVSEDDDSIEPLGAFSKDGGFGDGIGYRAKKF